MPELPDILVYLDALGERIQGRTLAKVTVRSPSLLRTHDPSHREAAGRRVTSLGRIGKRIVIGLEEDLFLIIHLMIAGRFQWKKPNVLPGGKFDHAAFAFEEGTLLLKESSPKKRAELHVVRGAEALCAFDRGGLDVLASDTEAFRAALLRENHTLKRALTDPRLLDGIGNAYSDEILHAAGLSPLKWTSRMDDEEIARLHVAARETLRSWIDRLRARRRGAFPEKVTAFREEMAVHGKHGQPCPACRTAVQRIRYADNETDYCPRCQTGGKLLADRALSRLLKSDWPRTIEDLEELQQRQSEMRGEKPGG